jgi:branched-chain amino acid transport system permease protein
LRSREVLAHTGARLAVGAACVVAALSLPLYVQADAMPAAAIALATIGWAFQARCAGDVSLAYGLFFGFGAYLTLDFVNHGRTAWLGIVVGMLAAALTGALISLATHRYKIRGLYYAFASLAVNLAALQILGATNIFGGVSGLILMPEGGKLATLALSTSQLLTITIVMIIVVGTVLYHLERARIGHLWRALREDEDAAAGLGVDVRALKVAAAAMGAAIAALAGALGALALGLAAPESALAFHISINVLVAAVFGGTAVWWFGPIGAIVITMIPSVLVTNANLPAESKTFVYGIALLLVVYLLPEGLLGTIIPWARRRLGRRPPGGRSPLAVEELPESPLVQAR